MRVTFARFTKSGNAAPKFQGFKSVRLYGKLDLKFAKAEIVNGFEAKVV
jgi:hypothetical protein